MLLTVAVIGPAHALKGEVRLEIRTDDPQGRLAPGAVLPTEPAERGPLTVSRLRFDGQRWFAAFEEAPDRTAAESLRGTTLLVDTDDGDTEGQDDGSWYLHELVGLTALLAPGGTGDGDEGDAGDGADSQADASGEAPTVLGEVVDVEPGVAQDRLIVRTPDGEDVAVPFVEQLVPEVDIEAGTLTLDPPGGLFPGLGQPEEVR